MPCKPRRPGRLTPGQLLLRRPDACKSVTRPSMVSQDATVSAVTLGRPPAAQPEELRPRMRRHDRGSSTTPATSTSRRPRIETCRLRELPRPGAATPRTPRPRTCTSTSHRGRRSGGQLQLLDPIKKVPGETGGSRQDPGSTGDQLMINLVSGCAKCHDPTTTRTSISSHTPKVNHSGLAPPGGWPAVAPK